MNTPPEECLHLEISSESEGKYACLECGLVQPIGVSNYSYVRSITHYKQLLNQGREVPPIYCLVGELLQEQVRKYKQRQNRNDLKMFVVETPCMKMYNEYLDFLNKNQNIVLPKKERKRELIKIYGEHKRLVLDYIELLLRSRSPE